MHHHPLSSIKTNNFCLFIFFCEKRVNNKQHTKEKEETKTTTNVYEFVVISDVLSGCWVHSSTNIAFPSGLVEPFVCSESGVWGLLCKIGFVRGSFWTFQLLLVFTFGLADICTRTCLPEQDDLRLGAILPGYQVSLYNPCSFLIYFQARSRPSG